MQRRRGPMDTWNILTLALNGTKKGASFNISFARVLSSIAYRGIAVN